MRTVSDGQMVSDWHSLLECIVTRKPNDDRMIVDAAVEHPYFDVAISRSVELVLESIAITIGDRIVESLTIQPGVH